MIALIDLLVMSVAKTERSGFNRARKYPGHIGSITPDQTKRLARGSSFEIGVLARIAEQRLERRELPGLSRLSATF